MMRSALPALGAAVLLSACETMSPEAPQPLRATAELQPTKGNKTFGEATFEQTGANVRVLVNVQGLKPGSEHGFHIHEVGDCSSGDGESAKGHFDPFAKPHGHHASAERHAGDLPSITADKSGRGKLDVEVDQITLTPGAASIIGRGVIVHADPDDYKSQPAGNAGARMACGVIREG
jgi:superoxide dismutase, Cu-Zn family